MPVKGKGKKATRKTATGSGSTVTHTTSPWDSWTDEDLSPVTATEWTGGSAITKKSVFIECIDKIDFLSDQERYDILYALLAYYGCGER
jgi:hypothetical protein